MTDFGGARKWAQSIVECALQEGSKAIDATMGNGHDTVWLAERVGKGGAVYAFDVQEEAVRQTKARLEEKGLTDRTRLFLKGHETMGLTVRAQVDAIMFNLGWLPGAEKAIRTCAKTTLSAVEQGLSLLKAGGVMTVCVYPGHEEGEEELAELLQWAKALDESRFDCMIQGYANLKKKKPPVLIAVAKKA